MPGDTETDRSRKNMERLSVNISPITAQALREIASAKATTVTEVIRRAVAVLKLLEDEQEKGNQVHLVDQDGSTSRQLHLI